MQRCRRPLSSGREHGGPLPLLSGLVRRGDWLPDRAQREVVEVLQRVYTGVAQPAAAGGGGDGEAAGVGGAYLHGPVGSGKTALMDLLASSCEAGQVRRLHFHELMGHVHAELHRGLSVPAIGAALGAATPLLCLDEMQLTDIADAAIVSRLVAAVCGAGARLVFTSNRAPHELYAGGLNRHVHIPAFCAALQAHGEPKP